jgi:hypothetical protein
MNRKKARCRSVKELLTAGHAMSPEHLTKQQLQSKWRALVHGSKLANRKRSGKEHEEQENIRMGKTKNQSEQPIFHQGVAAEICT